MALQQTIEIQGETLIQTSYGSINNGTQKILFPAYIKVVSISGNKTNVSATVEFKGETQLFSKQYNAPMSVETNSPNFIKQVYEYLKTLPEFKTAIDC